MHTFFTKMKKHIPNAITSLNLVSGSISVVLSLKGYTSEAAMLIFLGAAFDFLDGFTARLLKAYSELGKQLDSLADMVTFGVAPAALLYGMSSSMADASPYLIWMPLLIIVSAAFRLARFNIDDSQTVDFKGLASPANAFLIAGHFISDFWYTLLQNPYYWMFIILLNTWLMNAPFRMFSLKLKNMAWKGNEIRYTWLLLSQLAIIFLQAKALPVVLYMYISAAIIYSYQARQ